MRLLAIAVTGVTVAVSALFVGWSYYASVAEIEDDRLAS